MVQLRDPEFTRVHQEGHTKGMKEGFDRGASSVLYALLGAKGEVSEVAKDWIEGAKWKKLRIDTVARKLERTYQRETYKCNACGKEQRAGSPMALRWSGRSTEIVCKKCFENPPELKKYGKIQEQITGPNLESDEERRKAKIDPNDYKSHNKGPLT